MKIVILTIGTLGDVVPYAALGAGIQDAGYDVTLATHQCFAGLVSACGLRFEPLAGRPDEWAEGGELGMLAASGKGFLKWLLTLRSLAGPLIMHILDSCWEACRGAQAVIYSPLAWAGYSVAEKLGVPSFAACLQPVSPTRRFPSPWSHGDFKLGGAYNYLTHIAAGQAYWLLNKPFINSWRKNTLGLPPLPASGPYKEPNWRKQPLLYGFSPLVVPPPPDWPETSHVTGYWFPAEEPQQVDRALESFIEGGPPPVYIGFGSMPEGNPAELAGIVLEALKSTGQRAVIQGKWLSGRSLPEDVYHAGQVPHSWLFPRCRAAVHHGGASTTAQSLRAGIPAVVVPHAWDQFFWGKRVKELGVGPEPVTRKGLTARKLSRAIETAIKTESIQQRAAGLGQKIRAERGTENAVRIICEALKSPPGR